MAERMRVTSLMTPKHNAVTECQQCGSQRMQRSIQDGNALWHSCSGGWGDAERVPTDDALRAAVSSTGGSNGTNRRGAVRAVRAVRTVGIHAIPAKMCEVWKRRYAKNLGKYGLFSLRHAEWGSAAQPVRSLCRNTLPELHLHQAGPEAVSWACEPVSLRNFLLADSLNGPSRA